MDPDDFNHAELVAGRLTMRHITTLVREFQKARGFTGTTGPKALDGKCGKGTREELDKLIAPEPGPTPSGFKLSSPLPRLTDGRTAVVTSAFRTTDRPNHVGLDFFYHWQSGDKPDFVGDRGAAGKKGVPRWVVPYQTLAIAAAEGVVQIAGFSPTGYRCWIDHGNGLRTGYFHLLDLRINVGQVIASGTPLGLVGDNPKDHDGRHLHFELSASDRYEPINPAPFLA